MATSATTGITTPSTIIETYYASQNNLGKIKDDIKNSNSKDETNDRQEISSSDDVTAEASFLSLLDSLLQLELRSSSLCHNNSNQTNRNWRLWFNDDDQGDTTKWMDDFLFELSTILSPSLLPPPDCGITSSSSNHDSNNFYPQQDDCVVSKKSLIENFFQKYFVFENKADIIEWTQGVLFIQLILVSSANATRSNNNDDDLRFLLSPFELHSIIQQFWMSSSSSSLLEVDNNNEQRPFFRLTNVICWLIICSPSVLRQCPKQLRRRPKRWQSMVIETIQSYQRYVVDDEHRQQQRGSSGEWIIMIKMWTSYIVPAMIHVQLQTTMISNSLLMSDSTRTEDHAISSGTNHKIIPSNALLLAFAIQCISKLAEATISTIIVKIGSESKDNDLVDNIMQLLFHSFETMFFSLFDDGGNRGTSLCDNYSTLYNHSMRKYYYQQRSPETFSKRQKRIQKQPTIEYVLSLVTIGRAPSEDNDDNDDEIEAVSDDDDDQLDNQNHIITNHGLAIWSDVGVALLSCCGWHHRILVWSPSFTWQLFFPYVSILLLASQAQVDDDEDDENTNWISERKSVHRQQRLQVYSSYGYQLLIQLLQVTPDESMHRKSLPLIGQLKHPINPIGTFQLLANNVLSAAKAAPSTSTTANANNNSIQSVGNNTTPTVSGMNQLIRPDSTLSYRLMQQLLSKYSACTHYQYLIVQTLLEQCPEDSLRPKILDLLRIFVHWKNRWNNDTNDNDSTSNGIRAAWKLIQSYIQKLEDSHVVVVARSVSNNDNSLDIPKLTHDGQNNKKYELKEIEKLINDCEIYCSLLGLIEQWMIHHHHYVDEPKISVQDDDDDEGMRMIRTYNALQVPMEHVFNAMTNQLEIWSSSDNTSSSSSQSTTMHPAVSSSSLPVDYHRLYLLHNSLQRVVFRLTTMKQRQGGGVALI